MPPDSNGHHPLDPLVYYRFKAAVLALQLFDAQVMASRAALLETYTRTCTEAGLDPALPYVLRDADTSVSLRDRPT